MQNVEETMLESEISKCSVGWCGTGRVAWGSDGRAGRESRLGRALGAKKGELHRKDNGGIFKQESNEGDPSSLSNRRVNSLILTKKLHLN